MASQDKEELILDAARKVFIEKGPVEARMKDIADEADITPSLLHYYFRKRDDLYEAVIEQEIRRLIPKQLQILDRDAPLEERLHDFAVGVIDFHAENPHHAAFVAFEVHYNSRHLDRLQQAFSDLDLGSIQEELDRRSEAGEDAPRDARQLFVHILSLCIFPFIAQPIFRAIFDMAEEEYAEFMDERKKEVPLILNLALQRSKMSDTSEAS
jgi:AcrR family transcriptional regulator